MNDPQTPVPLKIDGTLDLHTFHPSQAKELIGEYILCCQAEGILQIRIIHGKGQGVLRRIVHSALGKHPHVLTFRTADESGGGWGATTAVLKPVQKID